MVGTKKSGQGRLIPSQKAADSPEPTNLDAAEDTEAAGEDLLLIQNVHRFKLAETANDLVLDSAPNASKQITKTLRRVMARVYRRSIDFGERESASAGQSP